MSLKSDVIITPVKMYFATSIRKSANFPVAGSLSFPVQPCSTSPAACLFAALTSHVSYSFAKVDIKFDTTKQSWKFNTIFSFLLS